MAGREGRDLKATARRRITAARDRGQHNKFPKSSSLLPSLPKSSGRGSGARRAAEGYTAAPRACACARSKLLARRERGRGWELRAELLRDWHCCDAQLPVTRSGISRLSVEAGGISPVVRGRNPKATPFCSVRVHARACVVFSLQRMELA